MNEKSYITGFFIIVLALFGTGVYFLSKQPKSSETVQNKVQDKQNVQLPEEKDVLSQTTSSEIPTNPKLPEMQLDTNKKYTAILHTTKGDITINLYADKTPITVNNFVTLAQKGFYNNTKFHRIMKDFMIQGGDPLGNGTGGPGYQFEDEPEGLKGEYTRGVVAMANAGSNTNGSQFFIMHKDVPLPKAYVIFGKVEDTAGLAIVDKIAETPVKENSFGERSTPTEDVIVKSVEIVEM